MTIAVMGSGGVGGYFGARLAAAGEEVAFIARGAHLEAMRERGLAVESPTNGVTVRPVRATDDPAEVGPVDVVMFCVKLWDTEAAGRLCRPLLGAETAVISFQNGIDAEPVLAAVLGREHVLGGVAAISAAISEPGVITHAGTMASLAFGELDGGRSARAEAFLAACRGAGIDAAVPDDIEAAIWQKFVLLSAFSAACCLARTAIGPLRDHAEGRTLLEALIAEAAAVARAKGVALGADAADKAMATVEAVPGAMRPSMLRDLEHGRRLEVAWLSGAVVRLGQELGVATPFHRCACGALGLHAEGPPAAP